MAISLYQEQLPTLNDTLLNFKVLFTSSSSRQVMKDMIQYFQQKCLLVVVLNCIQLCLGIQCEGECCYWYRKFPATSSDCHENSRTATVTLPCEVEYRPPTKSYNIEVYWYRSRDEESAGIEGEIILNDAHKYTLWDTDQMLMNQMNETSIRQYWVGISKFNSSDRGYYWCQMVVNNVTLSPSPYGHINDSQCLVQNVICNLDQPLCAQNTCAQCMAFNNQENSCSLINITGNVIWPTRKATVSPMVTSSITIIDITTVTMSNFPTTEVTSAIVAGIILLVLTIIVVLSIIYVKKHRSESKEHEVIVYHYAKIELNECEEANDISNPHYTEVRIATDQSHLPPMHETTVANDSSEMGDSGLSKTEHGSNTSSQEHPHSEADQIAQINDNSSDQTESQDSHKIQTETDISSEYAVVDKSKKTSRVQSNVNTATRADSAMENNHYDRLKQDRPAKDIIASEEGKDQVREKSPSPTYAELSVREKIPKVSKRLTEIDSDCELDSYEYASVDQASGKVTKGKPEEVEQHYYYSLENPAESCSDSKGKEEIINTGENKHDVLQFHHLVIQDKSIAPNTDEEAELASVKEINATPLDSHSGEAQCHTDKAKS